jgi:hypothetical protein
LGFGHIMHILGLKYIEINRYKYIMNNKNYITYGLIFILWVKIKIVFYY